MDVIVPALGESVQEGILSLWLCAPGDTVTRDQPLYELSTDKVDSEIPAPASGVVTKLLATPGDTVAVGQVIAIIEQTSPSDTEPLAVQHTTNIPTSTDSPTPPPALRPDVPPAVPPATPEQPRPVPANTKESLKESAPATTPPTTTPPFPKTPPSEQPLRDQALTTTPATRKAPQGQKRDLGPHTQSELTPTRKFIAQKMAHAAATIPHVLSVVSVDYTYIERHRELHKHDYKDRTNQSLTPLAYVARATAVALRDFTTLNAHFDASSSTLTTYANCHLGIAVDTPAGLLVPVVKNAGDLTVLGLASHIADLADAARQKRLGPDAITGSTFTITNNGSAGSELTAALINEPEVAVLSFDAIIKKPWAVQTKQSYGLAVRPIGNLSLSWDHRVIDGAYAARFLSRCKKILEDPDFEWGQ